MENNFTLKAVQHTVRTTAGKSRIKYVGPISNTLFLLYNCLT